MPSTPEETENRKEDRFWIICQEFSSLEFEIGVQKGQELQVLF